MKIWRLSLFLVAGIGMGATSTRAETLTGGVAAAYTTSEAADSNPANAAFLKHSEASGGFELYKTESLRVRYPGFAPVNDSNSGLGFPLATPFAIFKLSERFAIGGFAVPALPVKIPIERKKIPIKVLNSLDYVDIKGEGWLNGAAKVIVGYQLSRSFAIGINASYLAVGFNAELTPSSGGNRLASIDAMVSTFTTSIGIRWDFVPDTIAIGVATGVFALNNNQVAVDAPTLQGGAGTPSVEGAAPAASSGAVGNPLDSFLIGAMARFDKFRIMADVQYGRAPKDAKTFSLVDLAEKPRDLYDTVAVRAGARYQMNPKTSLLAGFRYEPSSLGPGSPGKDGLAGFGSMELIQAFSGFGGLKPYKEFSAGMELGFMRKTDTVAVVQVKKKRKKRVIKRVPYYALTVQIGVSVLKASIGIDEDGELPGAYALDKISVPVKATYRF